jgi:hypothetical protein
MLKAMARVAPSQPNEAMARVAPRRNGTISLDPSCRVKIPEQVFLDWTRNSSLFSKVAHHNQSVATESRNFTFSVDKVIPNPPVV